MVSVLQELFLEIRYFVGKSKFQESWFTSSCIMFLYLSAQRMIPQDLSQYKMTVCLYSKASYRNKLNSHFRSTETASRIKFYASEMKRTNYRFDLWTNWIRMSCTIRIRINITKVMATVTSSTMVITMVMAMGVWCRDINSIPHWQQ